MFLNGLRLNVGKVQISISMDSRFWKKWKTFGRNLEENKYFKSATFKTVSKFGRNGRKCYIVLKVSKL